MFRELDGFGDCVDNPTEEDFPCCPFCVAFRQFAEGNRFVAVLRIGGAIWSEDIIDGLEDGGAYAFAEAGMALSKA